MNTDTVVLSGFGTVELTNSSVNAEEYSWDFGDGSGADPTVDPIHPYMTEGTYTITLTAINYNCTTTTAQTIIVVPFGVGIEEFLSDDYLTIYPNPNTGQFVVEVNLDQASEMRVELNNVLGQRVYTEMLDQQHHWKKEFNLASYVKGVYLLRIATSQGVLQRRIIIE